MTELIVSASDFRKNFSKFVSNCRDQSSRVTIIRNSKPAAVLIEPDEYQKFLKWRREHFWEGVEEIEKDLEKGNGVKFHSVGDFIADLKS